MLNKANWTTDGDNVALSMPITKIDEENRLVSGWATLDNPDRQGDIVLAEASREAFKRFRGNIREMHQKDAVGRMVNFREDSYYDPQTEKFYNGIIVTAYVSKGAPLTWEKVLDGTLSGFSIQGPIIEAEPTIAKNVDGSISQYRVIKAYDLNELSLVDSPANQLANVVSIVKMTGGDVLKGMVAETRSENVFWCASEELAKTSPGDSADCVSCGNEMTNIGWFEYDSAKSATQEVRKVLDAYLNPSEGGNEMTKDNTEEVVEKAAEEAVVETDETAEVEKAEAEASDETSAVEETSDDVEKAADVSEVDDADDAVAKAMVAEFAKMRDEVISTFKEVTDAFASQLEATTERVTKAIDDLSSKQDELVTKFNELGKDVETIEKRLDSTEAEFAVKKSGDLGGEPENDLAKSKSNSNFWGGNILTSDQL